MHRRKAAWVLTGRNVAAALFAVPLGVLQSSVGCGGVASDAPPPEPGLAAFALEGDFVPIGKPAALPALGIGAEVSVAAFPNSGENFYLAVKKGVLAERWFLRAYMKQFYPGDVDAFNHREFGVRVVSFEAQNDRLFVFDASDLFKASAIGDPRLLIEAYPIVSSPEFDALPGSAEYLLVDPAEGLNEFSVSGHLYNDPHTQDLIGSAPLRLGLSFMQSFRRLDDGAAFEQVFNGDIATPERALGVWGTLGISLRRYAESPGFQAMPDPGTPFFLTSLPRLVPDSGGRSVTSPVRWSVREGMAPIQVFISAGAQRAQADLPGADIIGAFTRGVEGWNDAFGFPVLEAVFVADDAVRDDDATFILVDYPGQGLTFARGDYRQNPNTGEILGGSVYFSGNWFDFSRFEDDPEDPEPEAVEVEGVLPLEASFNWGGLTSVRSVCTLAAPESIAPQSAAGSGSVSRLGLEKGTLWIQHLVAHEVGHMLGLRHNLKGSLVPPSTSVMDYLVPGDAIVVASPGEYDRAAIAYLYELSTDLPSQPFCTDEGADADPSCAPDDSGARPLHDYWAPRYTAQLDLAMVSELPLALLDRAGLNRILGYARDPGELALRADRTAALRIAFGRSAAPIALEDTLFGARAANEIAEHVIRRLLLGPAEERGSIRADVTDVRALAYLIDQLGKMLRNDDRIRSYELRRTAVDALQALQHADALVALRTAHDLLETQLAGGSVPPADVPLADDLAARIDAALSPYFD